MDRLKSMIDMLNEQVYNPVGLNIKWPRSVAFLFVSRKTGLRMTLMTLIFVRDPVIARDRVLCMFFAGFQISSYVADHCCIVTERVV